MSNPKGASGNSPRWDSGSMPNRTHSEVNQTPIINHPCSMSTYRKTMWLSNLNNCQRLQLASPSRFTLSS